MILKENTILILMWNEPLDVLIYKEYMEMFSNTKSDSSKRSVSTKYCHILDIAHMIIFIQENGNIRILKNAYGKHNLLAVSSDNIKIE